MLEILENWLPHFPVFLTALSLIFIPGFIFTFLLGLKGITTLVVAPAFSTLTLTISAVLFQLLGIKWSWWSNISLAIIAGLAVWTILVLLKSKANLAIIEAQHLKKLNTSSLWLLISFFIGFICVSYFFIVSIKDPTHPALTWDSIFHQNAIRYIVDSGSASPMTLQQFINPTSFKFYPAVFHDFASQVMLLTGCSVPLAYNFVVVVFCAIIWVSAMLYLLYVLFPQKPLLWIAGMILSAGIPAYPYYQMASSGVIPNIVAYAFIPSGIALTYILVRKPPHIKITEVQCYISLFVILAASAFTHPSTVFSILVLSLGLIIEYFSNLYKNAKTKKGKILTLFSSIIFAIAITGAWILMSIPSDGNPPLKPYDPSTLWKLVTLTNLWGDWGQPIAIFVFLGLILALIYKNWRFVAIGYLAVWILYIVAAAFPNSSLRNILTGIWYNSIERISCLLVPFIVVLSCILFNKILSLVSAKSKGNITYSYIIGTLLLIISLFFTFTPTMHRLANYINEKSYAINENQPMMTPEKAQMDQEIANYVPGDGSVIANNPYNGSQLIYALSDRTLLFPFQRQSFQDNNQKIIAQNLKNVATNPTVCPALQAKNVHYAVDYGEQYINGKNEEGIPTPTDYPGITNLDGQPGFQLLKQYGDVKLYKITACNQPDTGT